MHSGREAGTIFWKGSGRGSFIYLLTGTLAFLSLNLASSDTTHYGSGADPLRRLFSSAARCFAFIFAGSSAAFTVAATFGIF